MDGDVRRAVGRSIDRAALFAGVSPIMAQAHTRAREDGEI
jgi:hypothetical protein